MGSSPRVETRPVNVQETSRQAVETQIEFTPQILETQREFGPQFAELDVANLERFLPELAELSRGIQREDVALQRELFPSVATAEESLERVITGEDISAQRRGVREDLGSAINEFLSGEDPLTAIQRRNIEQDVRAGQQARGIERFGFANIDEAVSIENLREQVRTDRLNARLQKVNFENQLNLHALNTALSTANRVPVSAGQNIQFQQPQRLVQNVTPGQIFGAELQNADNALRASAANASRPTFASAFGGFLGQTAGTATGFGLGKAFGAF